MYPGDDEHVEHESSQHRKISPVMSDSLGALLHRLIFFCHRCRRATIADVNGRCPRCHQPKTP